MRKHLPIVAIVLCLVAVFSIQALAQEAVRTGDITAIAAETKSFTVKTARGETNITTTAATVVKDGDRTLTFADLKVGDTVKVTGVRSGTDVEAKEIAKQPK